MSETDSVWTFTFRPASLAIAEAGDPLSLALGQIVSSPFRVKTLAVQKDPNRMSSILIGQLRLIIFNEFAS